MKIVPIVETERQVIQGDGEWAVGGVRRDGGILVFPDRVEPWSCTNADKLSIEDFFTVLASTASLRICCGSNACPILPVLRAGLSQAGSVAEAMDADAPIPV